MPDLGPTSFLGAKGDMESLGRPTSHGCQGSYGAGFVGSVRPGSGTREKPVSSRPCTNSQRLGLLMMEVWVVFVSHGFLSIASFV